MAKLAVRKQTRIMTMVLLLISSSMLTGCLALAVGAATVSAIDLALDRRTTGNYIDDNTLEIQIRKDIISDNKFENSHINIFVVNEIVLLTGEVSNEGLRQDIAAKANKYTQARQVVNEIKVAPNSSFASRTRDSLITAKVKTALITAMGAATAKNIKVATESSRVYLMGIVNQAEANKAVNVTREVGGVSHIVKVFDYRQS